MDWIAQTLLEALGWTLLHSLWQLLLVASVLWIFFSIHVFKTPQRRYLLGLSALLAIFCLFVGTFVYEYREHQLPLSQEAHLSTVYSDLDGNLSRDYFIPGDFSQTIEDILPYMVHFWLIGVMFYFFRHAANIAALKRLKARSAKVLPGNIEKAAQRIKQQLAIKIPVNFKLNEEITVPIAFGLWKPVVLIPASLLFQLSPLQLEAIIAHELVHIRRHDYTINLGQSVLEIIFFYHPAFWWINSLVKEAREHIADDMALRTGVKPIDLANALAIVANNSTEQSLELGMAAHSSKFPILNRIKRILGRETVQFSYSPLITKTMLLTLLFSAVLLIGSANEMQNSRQIWVTTTLESNFEFLPFQFPDTIKQAVNVENQQVISQDINVDVQVDENINDFKMDVELMHSISSQVMSGLPDSLPQPPMLQLSPPPVPAFEPAFQDSLQEYTSMFTRQFGDSIQQYTLKIIQYSQDTSVLSQQQKEKMEGKLEAFKSKMADSQKELELKVKEWEKEFQPKMEAFERKMKAWQKDNEPKIKAFEEKMEKWVQAQQESIKDWKEDTKLNTKERDW